MKTKKFKLCSLFAGIGGFELGFKGFDVVYANEIDKYACRTYRMNFPNTHLDECDVCNVDCSDIPDFDVLTAGFPCQTFSSVGLQQGFNDKRGTMFFEILRFLKQKKPKAILLENVSNLLKHDNGNTFSVIKSSLENLGYSIKYEVMNALDYGIPQQRNRIFIVGFLDNTKTEHFVFPKHIKLRHDAFYFLDKIKQPDSYYMTRHKRWDEINSHVIDNRKIYRFTDWGFSSGKAGICPTLLAAMGSQFERIPFFRDEFSIRKLTQRECARLQGIPDSYEFDMKAPKQVYKQIGNSVCVNIVSLLAKEIKKQLLEVYYE